MNPQQKARIEELQASVAKKKQRLHDLDEELRRIQEEYESLEKQSEEGVLDDIENQISKV